MLRQCMDIFPVINWSWRFFSWFDIRPIESNVFNSLKEKVNYLKYSFSKYTNLLQKIWIFLNFQGPGVHSVTMYTEHYLLILAFRVSENYCKYKILIRRFVLNHHSLYVLELAVFASDWHHPQWCQPLWLPGVWIFAGTGWFY